MSKITNTNQSIWLKMKSPFGQEQYIPRIIDITADNIQQYKQKSRCMKFCLFLLLLLLLLLLIASILLPILLIKSKQRTTTPSTTTITIKTTTTTTTTAS
ncbi:unnamed protein product [Rotaria sp. Silwood1]|nr:unnamed protein product [Rotaria sp. Silwood1]CAF1690201.1 unnamed protein product [Rotaria sp. Silwood1]CAF3922428.1 unnamed protein product [Rotaria sp. Silwood1]CAF4067869.1 unnamed protein product [Rotaria sp. Silwood1]CAF5032920.1 unnamed protein product [Rotaria sp. Silwood1]